MECDDVQLCTRAEIKPDDFLFYETCEAATFDISLPKNVGIFFNRKNDFWFVGCLEMFVKRMTMKTQKRCQWHGKQSHHDHHHHALKVK